MPYIYVRYVALPRKIEAVVLPNDDSSFDIYINSVLCDYVQRKALQHEIRHIKENHLYNSDPVVINERDANTEESVDKEQFFKAVNL